MNKKGTGFGIFLLSIGIIWILVNFNVINLNIFRAIFTLWPLLLVVAGINIIFKENVIVKSLTWIGFLALLIIYGSFNTNTDDNWSFGKFNPDATQHFEQEMKSDLKNGTLNFNAGGVKVDFQDEQDKLIVVDSEQRNINCNVDYNSGDKVDIDLDNKGNFVFNTKNSNRMNVKLNNKLIWDIKMDTGATDGDLDLSKLKVKYLDIDSGAVNYRIKLGANLAVTDVKLDSGASNFDFSIPNDKDVGYRVKLDGGMNNTNLSNLGWSQNGNTFESPNYNNAKSKINMDLKIGVSKVNFDLY